MKYIILHKVLDKLKKDPKAFKKIKVVVITVLLGFFVASIFAVYIGIRAVGYISTQAQNRLESTDIQSTAVAIRTELESITAFQTANCWNKIQSMLDVQIWMSQPLSDNLKTLRLACLSTNASKPAATLAPLQK